MKTKLIMFSLIVTLAMTNVFANGSNNKTASVEEIQQQKVDQTIIPKSNNYIMFDNQTGEGNRGTIKVDYDTMNMTFSVAASKAAQALQLPKDYSNYIWKNSSGQVLDFNRSCTSQGVTHSSTVTVTK